MYDKMYNDMMLTIKISLACDMIITTCIIIMISILYHHFGVNDAVKPEKVIHDIVEGDDNEGDDIALDDEEDEDEGADDDEDEGADDDEDEGADDDDGDDDDEGWDDTNQ